MAEETYPTSEDLNYLKTALGDLPTPQTTVPTQETAPSSTDLSYIISSLAE